MPSFMSFRLSTYASLTLACLCVAYSEWTYLKVVSYFAGVVIAALGISFFAGKRFELSITAANLVGTLIGFGVLSWFAFQFADQNSLIHTLPWPAGILPYFGPLIMVLMPAKLFRPKHVGDWWAMHGIGLAAVSVGCAMTDDALFGLLLVAYALTTLWALAQLYYQRSVGALALEPGNKAEPKPIVLTDAHAGFFHKILNRSLLLRSTGWFLSASVLAVPLFLLTPRSETEPWHLAATAAAETGLSGDAVVDLSHEHRIELNHDVAVNVTVTDKIGRSKERLPLDRRFRSFTYIGYFNGKWHRGESSFGTIPTPNDVRNGEPMRWPDYGPSTLTFDYAGRTPKTPIVVAEPILALTERPIPVAVNQQGKFQPVARGRDGYPSIPYKEDQQLLRWRQTVGPADPEGPEFGPIVSMKASTGREAREINSSFNALTTSSLPRLEFLAHELLERLAKEDSTLQQALQSKWKRGTGIALMPQHYEMVARALSKHLSQSGEYSYSLDLKRIDKSLDPVEDFLIHTKSGHCERYASALAQLTRAVGIPSRLVTGFRGWEARTPGTYVIRNEHAHAWVEILVPRNGAGGVATPADQKNWVWRWLTLDPTPSTSAQETNWIASARKSGEGLYEQLVNFDESDQENAVQEIQGFFVDGWGSVILGAVLILGLLAIEVTLAFRRMPEKSAKKTELQSGIEWFDRYRKLLQKRGKAPIDGQTIREHARTLSESLAGDPRTVSVSQVPIDTMNLYYAVRFAGCVVGPDEVRKLQDAHRQLDRALRAATRPLPSRP